MNVKKIGVKGVPKSYDINLVDALLNCILWGEPDHLHLIESGILKLSTWKISAFDANSKPCLYLLGLANPVAPVLCLLIIIRVEVQVVQDHLKTECLTTSCYFLGARKQHINFETYFFSNVIVLLFCKDRHVYPTNRGQGYTHSICCSEVDAQATCNVMNGEL